MANFKDILSHVAKWEGSCGSDPVDNALKLGHSGVLGKDVPSEYQTFSTRKYPNNYVHTCKGVIWATYVAYCSKVKKTPNAQEFIKMPKSLWEDIIYYVFWKPRDLDNLKSQALANFIFDVYWGSGTGGAKPTMRALQNELNKHGAKLTADGVVGKGTIEAINKYTKDGKDGDREKQLLKVMYDARKEHLSRMDDAWKYLKGWTNRLNALYERSLGMVGAATATGLGVILIAAGIYYYYKNKMG